MWASKQANKQTRNKQTQSTFSILHPRRNKTTQIRRPKNFLRKKPSKHVTSFLTWPHILFLLLLLLLLWLMLLLHLWPQYNFLWRTLPKVSQSLKNSFELISWLINKQLKPIDWNENRILVNVISHYFLQ